LILDGRLAVSPVVVTTDDPRLVVEDEREVEFGKAGGDFSAPRSAPVISLTRNGSTSIASVSAGLP